LACTAAENYGLYGKGYLFILRLQHEVINTVLIKHWPDCLFDVCYSEDNPDLLLTAAGDGNLQLWDISQLQNPIIFNGHSREVYCVQWNQTRSGNIFLSGSWDHTVKLWDVHRNAALQTFAVHEHYIYDISWSPKIPGCFASASGDGQLGIWNINQGNLPLMLIRASAAEVLSCDWNKYDEFTVVTGGTDSIIRGWDTRNVSSPKFELFGHTAAVRRVRFSPHFDNVLFSCSYDFTTKKWTLGSEKPDSNTISQHSEFVYGLDVSVEGADRLVAECSWDRSLNIHLVP